jgi:DNA polymerase elongation subunit (family B)
MGLRLIREVLEEERKAKNEVQVKEDFFNFKKEEEKNRILADNKKEIEKIINNYEIKVNNIEKEMKNILLKKEHVLEKKILEMNKSYKKKQKLLLNKVLKIMES